MKKSGLIVALSFLVLGLIGYTLAQEDDREKDPEISGALNTAFLIAPGVYNSELMAPYDVFQHSIFRDSLNYMKTYIVAETMAPVMTFEGIEVKPHFTFDSAPKTDVLVIPSTLHSMDGDLKDEEYMSWLKEAVNESRYIVTVCDGAFPLAATGVLNGRKATTFPSDRDAFQEMFPDVEVLYDQRVVVDDKYITSVGGAMSYEPAFYLVEKIYSKEHADKTAQGLVWDWDLKKLPILEN